ncbi:MAG: hypothetical protein Q7S21_06650 [archaeon]|nr:hypothetical protein [archaeon]
MSFVNTLPYISNPIEEFSDFKFVSWEKEIYPKYKGNTNQKEINFYTNLIMQNNLKNIIDFGLGQGTELSGIIEQLKKANYNYESAEANEVSEEFIRQAKNLFEQKKQKIVIHKANWLNLLKAAPKYSHLFDFGFLTGNSLTMIGGKTKKETSKIHKKIANNFAQLIKKDGYLFIDSRNYNYIKSLKDLSIKEVIEKFSFDYSVYYHGKILFFPVHISDNLVVMHYYDKENKEWSKLDIYTIYQENMIEILGKDFKIEKIFHDFEEKKKNKSLFVQYLAKRK